MMITPEFKKHFWYLGQELINEILEASVIKEVPKNAELIREGEYVRAIPIVLQGLVKVIMRQDDKELLLYYIQPNETCIMSFSACLKNEKSKIYAISEEESSVALIPADKIPRWIVEYPNINQLFYQQYDQRYSEMIDMISHLLFDKLDKRILAFIIAKTTVTGKNPVKISHKEIANDLGTAREVVSRLIKKLEKEKKVIQHSNSIEIL